MKRHTFVREFGWYIDLPEYLEQGGVKGDPAMGGGYYLMERFEGKEVGQRMWLCAVTNFVFGHLPQRIWVRRVDT